MPASGPRSRGARAHPRSCQGCRPWPRASAASGLVLATQKLGGITGRGTRGTLVGEGFEQSRGDAFPAPALDHGSPGRGAERLALLVRECQEARKLRSEVLDVARLEAREVT